MKKIVILTGSELRHHFFRKYLSSKKGIVVVNSYCEGQEKSLRSSVEKDGGVSEIRLKHLLAREQSERDFFDLYVESTIDKSNPIFLPKGQLNSEKYSRSIIDSRPDLLIAYGCSIVKEPLLSAFAGRFLNVHLGLSPYYRGSGTNYWPLVNGEPEYVGATFMHIDAGIDTGEIVHQIRANFCWGDTPSQVGNRLIVDMARTYKDVIMNFENLQKMPQLSIRSGGKVYKMKDYTEDSVVRLYRNFGVGLVEAYLSEEAVRCSRVPIVVNPALGCF